MIKRLLLVCAVAGVLSMVCFTFLGVMGGFPEGFNNGPWANGNGNWNWGRGPRDAGPTVTRSMPYSGSSRLEIAYPADITYTQGDQPSFNITGPQNVIDDLQLNDGVLESRDGPGRGYGWRGWNRRDNGRLTITVVGPNTHEFHLAGAEKLTIRNFDQDSLVLHIAGAADVDGQGKAKRLEAHIAGAGNLELEQLTVDDADVSMSGASDANLDARRRADVSISGAGHIRFKCRPADGASQHISGFGSVDEGPNCTTLPEAPASSAPPAAPAAPAPKSNI
jgi:Putative auto-transporter adhesin, head GIN domain